jgi:hypothetical protein
MAYDTARTETALFGGYDGSFLGDTWTWDGSDWTERTPAHSPPARGYPGMAYAAAPGQVVLFGGGSDSGKLDDTWIWAGSDWTRQFTGSIKLSLQSGPPDTVVEILGSGFSAGEHVRLTFVDSSQGTLFLKKVKVDATGAFSKHIAIPTQVTPGTQRIKAKGNLSREIATRNFTVM